MGSLNNSPTTQNPPAPPGLPVNDNECSLINTEFASRMAVLCMPTLAPVTGDGYSSEIHKLFPLGFGSQKHAEPLFNFIIAKFPGKHSKRFSLKDTMPKRLRNAFGLLMVIQKISCCN